MRGACHAGMTVQLEVRFTSSTVTAPFWSELRTPEQPAPGMGIPDTGRELLRWCLPDAVMPQASSFSGVQVAQTVRSYKLSTGGLTIVTTQSSTALSG